MDTFRSHAYRGDELPAHHSRLSRGDLVNYAGDVNPIDWDEDIAKPAGPRHARAYHDSGGCSATR